MSDQALINLFIVTLIFAAVPAVTFVALYGTFVRELTTAGKHMLLFTAVVATLILDQLAVLIIDGWGRNPVHVWVLFALFVLLGAALWHRLFLFFKEQVVFNPPRLWRRGAKHGGQK